jgi:disulfide bond formation protein DsbB
LKAALTFAIRSGVSSISGCTFFACSALALAGYILGIVADLTHDSESPIYVAACLTKILFFVIAVPLAHSAGKIIRKETNEIGIPGLRLVGWIMFGAALIHFMTFFVWTGGGNRLPDGQITIDAAMFFMASMCMIAESWNSYKSKD